MPRANRYILPRQSYHITHRCHNRNFLLRFAKDRNSYRKWLRKGAARYNVLILGYCITSNHVHLLVFAENNESVSKMMQFVAGNSAQEYNRRKDRKGAFWEDRFHCTMIDSGRYLWNCLAYIDLNMVRAGVISHPGEWEWCGYNELMGIRKRYRVLDLEALIERGRTLTATDLRNRYQKVLKHDLEGGELKREPKWTESLAIGDQKFVESLKDRFSRIKLTISQDELTSGSGSTWSIREESKPYS